ncbi:MAG: hypothetical protein RI897_4319 [Verrucomicrobiota bacterium]
MGGFGFTGEDIGDGPEFCGALGGEGLAGGAGATSAAADEGDFDGILFGRVAWFGGSGGEGRPGEGGGGGFEEVAAGLEGWGGFCHK